MNKRISSSIPLNILVIEDNPGDFLLLEEYIEEMLVNSTITQARSYLDACTILSDQKSVFDLILLDLTLPDNQGLILVSDVLGLANESPVIILTGYENLDFSISSLALGISEYLLKDEITAYSLQKSILFSIEREKHLRNIKESEKRYSELFHLSPIPMWVYETSSLQIVNVNPAAIKKYGYSETEFLNMSVLRLLSNEEKQRIHDLSNPQFNDSNKRMEHKLKDGKVIQVQMEQNHLTLNNRACCIMLSNDITELIETQDSLRTAYRNIIEIEEKEKEKFAAELHDGIQQNLVAAKLIFSFLTEQSTILAQEPRAVFMNQSLETALDECYQIIRDIRPKRIIENGFYAEIEGLIQKVKATGTMEVLLTKDAEMDQLFEYFDLMHIYRITQELFNNALKYAAANKFELSFSIQANQLQLTFTDDGNGISKAILNSKSSFISIKRRVQILNASMVIKSEPNKGSSFHLCIPLK